MSPLSRAAASAQSLTLDPAFMAALGEGATCHKGFADGTNCAIQPRAEPPVAFVALATGSGSCTNTPLPTHDLCAPDALEQMAAVETSPKGIVDFAYRTSGRTFECTLFVDRTVSAAETQWSGGLRCTREPDQGERWGVTNFPDGVHLYSQNGATEFSVLCRDGDLEMTLTSEGATPEPGGEVQLGISKDARTEPPPFDVLIPAVVDERYGLHARDNRILVFLDAISSARKYVDIGAVGLDGAPLSSKQMLAGGSTKAVTSFLEACV